MSPFTDRITREAVRAASEASAGAAASSTPRSQASSESPRAYARSTMCTQSTALEFYHGGR